jgi:hypothetical protein
MTDLTLRPISGPDELPLFSRLPYVLNPELAGDLAAGATSTTCWPRAPASWPGRTSRTSGPPPTSATSRWPGRSPGPGT